MTWIIDFYEDLYTYTCDIWCTFLVIFRFPELCRWSIIFTRDEWYKSKNINYLRKDCSLTFQLIFLYMYIVSGLVPTVKLLQRHKKCIVRLSIFPKKKDFKSLDSTESYWNSLTIAATILERRGFIQDIPSGFFWMHNEILFKLELLSSYSVWSAPLLTVKIVWSAPFLTKLKLSDPLLSSQSQKFLIRSGSEAFEFVSLFFLFDFLKIFKFNLFINPLQQSANAFPMDDLNFRMSVEKR